MMLEAISPICTYKKERAYLRQEKQTNKQKTKAEPGERKTFLMTF